jgi:2-methylcitrate dehydratase PrpD
MSKEFLGVFDELAINRRNLFLGTAGVAALGAMPQMAMAQSTAESTGPGQINSVDFTQQLAEFVATVPENSVTSEAYELAKIILMDTIGCAIASSEEPLVIKLKQYCNMVGGNQQSTLIFENSKMSAPFAALINGAAVHAMDYDDSSKRFWGHASTSIIPSLLAVAELKGRSGRDLLTAYLIGLQASFVVSDSVGEAMYTNGLHNTSSLGVIASGAACARLMGLDATRASYALAASATQSFGLKRSFGTMCKPLHAGRAAEAAVMAALLAENDFTGAPDIFEGANGLFAAFGGEMDVMPLSTLGSEWDVGDVRQKLHAACQWTHSPINAAIALKEQHAIDPSKIASIEILASDIALKTADVVTPQTGLQAKFSVPYGVANALVTGETGLAGYTDEAVTNTEVIALIDKISSQIHPRADKFEARVTIKLNDGTEYTQFDDVFAATPTLPERREAAVDKFMGNASGMLGDARAKDLSDMLLGFENVASAAEVFSVIHR